MKPLFFAVTLLSILFAQSALAGTVAPTPPESAYAQIDVTVAALNKSVEELVACVNVAEYLSASAAKSAKQTKTADEQVPSHLAKLAPFKFKVAESKRVACLLQGNEPSGSIIENTRTPTPSSSVFGPLENFPPRSVSVL